MGEEGWEVNSPSDIEHEMSYYLCGTSEIENGLWATGKQIQWRKMSETS
jgi:hypothetical protein